MQGHMHHKRRLLIALVATGGFSVALTSFAVTANAAQRTFVITVVGNIKKTITVDVGADTPIDQIKLPSILGLPILDITEITPAAPAAPAAPAVTAVPGITAEPSAGEAIAGEAITQAQRTTGKKKRDPPVRRARARLGRQRHPRRGHEGAACPPREDEAPLPRRRSDAAEPDHVPGIPGPGGGRRSELLHRQVPHPRLPALDLPGRRHPVRRAVGGPRGDQRDRDELRAQPQRVQRGRDRLDAVHPLELEGVRSRRQRRRQEGPVQPGRRDLRRGALPQGRRRVRKTSARRSSPTTTPTGTSTRCSCVHASSAGCRPTSSARSAG